MSDVRLALVGYGIIDPANPDILRTLNENWIPWCEFYRGAPHGGMRDQVFGNTATYYKRANDVYLLDEGADSPELLRQQGATHVLVLDRLVHEYEEDISAYKTQRAQYYQDRGLKCLVLIQQEQRYSYLDQPKWRETLRELHQFLELECPADLQE